MKIQPGQLKHRVEFHRNVIVDDGHGGERTDYQVHKRQWAMVQPLSGTESQSQDRISSKVNYLVVIRNRPDVLASDRIKWNGLYLNIVAPMYPADGQYLEIQCEQGTAT